MRISGWSSDVCSSDLHADQQHQQGTGQAQPELHGLVGIGGHRAGRRRCNGSIEHDLAFRTKTKTSIEGSSDRTSVVKGKSVLVRVILGGRRIINKKQYNTTNINTTKINTRKQL